MKYIVSGEEMAQIDSYATKVIGLSQMALMERAALKTYEFIREKFPDKIKVLVAVCGGNNGGDGIALARMLGQAGDDVEVYYVDVNGRTSEGFKRQYEIAKKLQVRFIDELVDAGYDLIVDAIFGVGLDRAVSGKQETTIRLLNDFKGYKLAIDIPSGVDAYTGFVRGVAFRADATITFGLMKLGLMRGVGPEYCGEVRVVGIGFPKQAVEHIAPSLFTYELKDLDHLLPTRRADTHKGSYGRVGVIGGSKNMAGAVLFSAEAAYRMGCGLVKVCTDEVNREIVQTRLPEALLETYDSEDRLSVEKSMWSMMKWADVLVVGPGLGKSEAAVLAVSHLLRYCEKTIILDADGLNILAEHKELLKEKKAEIIITPHLLEMSRVSELSTAEIKEHMKEIAQSFASMHKVIVVLKDARTIVSDGSPQSYLNYTGNNGMATGGTGDVLTGMIAGLIAQGVDGYDAAKLGVFLHGLAGERAAKEVGCYSMTAGNIVKCITKVLEGDDNDQ
ncbi:MAG: NAD(P)H-hydrate dehydratase [Lachnospiraceae bacterium]|nr:NAD(P)H-hydrate dehydratase [Lachnospiraceae bacterium]